MQHQHFCPIKYKLYKSVEVCEATMHVDVKSCTFLPFCELKMNEEERSMTTIDGGII